LEEKGTCNGQECLDWVEITLNNLGTAPRICGSGEVGEVHADGANEMTLEFASNRRTEDGGFLYFVTCADPGFDQNAQNSGIVPQSQAHSYYSHHCSQPPNMSPRPNTIEAPSGLFEQVHLSRSYVVKMSGSIFYKDDVIQVRDGLRVLYTMRGIIRLEVANRFSTTPRRYYRSKVGVTFKGYGESSPCVLVDITQAPSTFRNLDNIWKQCQLLSSGSRSYC
jgi:hypothetical protein